MAPKAQTRLVPANLEGPVDRVVRGLFGTSWGKARGWIEGGKVRVGGALVTDTTARVQAGAEIAVDEAARKPHALDRKSVV
jgi:ribosomal protein S4